MTLQLGTRTSLDTWGILLGQRGEGTQHCTVTILAQGTSLKFEIAVFFLNLLFWFLIPLRVTLHLHHIGFAYMTVTWCTGRILEGYNTELCTALAMN